MTQHFRSSTIKRCLLLGCRDGPSKDLLYKSVEQAGFPTGSVEWINLDMSSMESVRAFGQAILDKNVPISLLINNGVCNQFILQG